MSENAELTNLADQLADRLVEHGVRYEAWFACFAVALEETQDIERSLGVADDAVAVMAPDNNQQ